LPHRVHWHARHFLAVLAHDEVLAALADVAAGFLDVEYGPVIGLRDDARQAGRRGRETGGERGRKVGFVMLRLHNGKASFLRNQPEADEGVFVAQDRIRFARTFHLKNEFFV
jgi:hypothetical protein